MADDLGSTEREIVAQRIKKAEALAKLGVNPYGNGFRPRHLASDLTARYGSQPAEEIARDPGSWSVAGRCLAIRSFGKAAFLRVRDRSGEIQVWVKKDKVGERGFQVFQLLDVGDVVGAEGPATRTKTGELTVEASSFTVLTKAIRPLPEKWHGLSDVEARYRQRYLDLLANPEVRRGFVIRSRMISAMREWLDARDFLEVETPILQPIYGGAHARPFPTHHHLLDQELFIG